MFSRGWLASEALSTPHIYALLEFLEIPGKCKKPAVKLTVLASVKALYFMHQVRYGGLYSRRKMEADQHSNACDSQAEATDDEELRTTLPKQRQRISPNVAVVPAACPSNNGNPIPANQLSEHKGNAEPARDDNTARALELHHRPCHAHQETPKRQRPNPTRPQGTAAPQELPEQPMTTDHSIISVQRTTTAAASGRPAKGYMVGDQVTRPHNPTTKCIIMHNSA